MSDGTLQAINDYTTDNLSERTANIPIKDLFFMSDLEKYYKYGKQPFMLYLQAFLIILTTTIILLSTDELKMFKNHIRSIDKTFIPELETNMDAKAEIFIQNITELVDRIDYVMASIFDFENLFTHDVKIIELNKLKMNVFYNHLSPDNRTIQIYNITNRNDNPIKKLGSNQDIRKLLSKINMMSISIKYNMRTPNRARTLKLIWTTYFTFSIESRGIIKLQNLHKFNYHKGDLTFWQYLEKSIIYEYGVLNIFIIIFAIIQATIIAKRIYMAFKALMDIKRELDKIQDFDEDSILGDPEEKSYFYSKGKTKWDMLNVEDKRKFFNLWYFIILMGNLFQIISSINHILFPVLNDTNQFLCATSCLLSWFGCGYFLEYEDRYYFFYLTIEKSLKTHFKYLLVFALVFVGYGILTACTFNYSEKHYSNLHMAFMTSFAGLMGDTLADNWSKTMEIDPLKTIFFSIFYFITFVAFLLRMILTITEESFDCIRMRKSYYWLDNKLSVTDYIRHEIDHKQNINEEQEGHRHEHYMMSDAIMNIILSMDQTKGEMPERVEKILFNRVSQLKENGLNDQEISMIIKKELRRFVKQSYARTNMKINESDTGDSLTKVIKTGATDINQMQHFYETVDGLLNEIEGLFKSLDDLIIKSEITYGLTPIDTEEVIKKIISFTVNVMRKLSKIKDII